MERGKRDGFRTKIELLNLLSFCSPREEWAERISVCPPCPPAVGCEPNVRGELRQCLSQLVRAARERAKHIGRKENSMCKLSKVVCDHLLLGPLKMEVQDCFFYLTEWIQTSTALLAQPFWEKRKVIFRLSCGTSVRTFTSGNLGGCKLNCLPPPIQCFVSLPSLIVLCLTVSCLTPLPPYPIHFMEMRTKIAQYTQAPLLLSFVWDLHRADGSLTFCLAVQCVLFPEGSIKMWYSVSQGRGSPGFRVDQLINNMGKH